MTDLIASLRQIVGDAHVLTDGDLTAYEQDWRRRVHGKALAVVRPANTAQVAAVVKACAANGTSIVPQGGNTGLVVGSTPDTSGQQVVLNLGRMQAIRAIDKDNLTVTVEAGCILQTLQERCESQGYLFPLSLAAEGSCTIGGNLGTNAGGTQVVRYGNTRELCLGLEVVNAQGEVWEGLKGLRKDNTGYDLRNLFIGSEGTLGVITAATMKIYPMPASQLTAWAALPSFDAAVRLLALAHQYLGAGLTGFEVMNRFALTLVDKHMPQLRVPFIDNPAFPYAVVLENSDSESEEHARSRFEALMEAAFEQEIVLDAVVAENLAQAHTLWHIRESIPLAQVEEGLNIKHDISVPISRIPEFVEHATQVLNDKVPGMRLVNFGHLGDGNLHFNVQAPEGVDAKQFLDEREHEVNHIVYDAVAAFGGSISAEHGIGTLKVDTLPQYQSPVALSMMRAVKAALDPQNIMNPHAMITRG
ncbi:FAD-binding oxidoreductase [Comamonas piscis]|uniref:FAD-binding oxidoreductase n=1 Tax=Comamonas piscis TaxID=1562974 RepID=A0A7G5EJZ2_9BURK|nr:FAD-binding oxidoreductase [Comamonas piscis]QMV74317.1 FAD-binding oxidoreductase [Comamonas piscis]WSO32763.1 FAD-binding oxidoreductase [Comamonas piscis]